ncbi:MAG: hypothetical protein OHK93_008401 [Ramalina farinacea]|uniref:Amino acid permease/ SLC12A domain-containing protein n=1 Tax=Ramalina farinacea TaxID=258253 RepID=A0AA43TV22_9LECA|nr:hypothetical protein [Ramalina farinacea]
MDTKDGSDVLAEKRIDDGSPPYLDREDHESVSPSQNVLHRDLKGRHMQMIAIGGAIGSGLFIGSGGAFQTGGPASVFLGFLIIGIMIYLMMQALAELSVMYPINGAFTMYIVRFVDPSFGFACAWEYAITFAYTGTELTGLAAAETANPAKEIPKASKQVVWRIGIFYVVNLLLVGLVVPENSPLYTSGGSESRGSPFVIAIQLAGIKSALFAPPLVDLPPRAANGHSLDELPYRAACGVWGSYVCLLINVVALLGQFYVALYPVGGPYLQTDTFFQLYLAGPLLIFLYFIWKLYSWFARPADRPLFIRTKDIDIYTGMRDTQSILSDERIPEEQRRASIQEMQDEKRKKSPKDHVMGIVRNFI